MRDRPSYQANGRILVVVVDVVVVNVGNTDLVTALESSGFVNDGSHGTSMRSDFLFEAIHHAHAIGFLGRVTVHPFLSLLRLISFYGYWCDLSADAVVSHAAMPRARVCSHTHTHSRSHDTETDSRFNYSYCYLYSKCFNLFGSECDGENGIKTTKIVLMMMMMILIRSVEIFDWDFAPETWKNEDDGICYSVVEIDSSVMIR